MSSDASVLSEYYGRLDGDRPGNPLDLLADDFCFSMDLCGVEVPGGHVHYQGARGDMDGYVTGRPPGRRHHLIQVSQDGSTAVAIGRVSENGEHLAMFLAAMETNERGQITRYLVSRSSALTMGSLPPSSSSVTTG
jgi:hypothetical protein